VEKRKSASSPVFARNFGFENFVEFDWILCGTTVENFFVSKDRCKIPGVFTRLSHSYPHVRRRFSP